MNHYHWPRCGEECVGLSVAGTAQASCDVLAQIGMCSHARLYTQQYTEWQHTAQTRTCSHARLYTQTHSSTRNDNTSHVITALAMILHCSGRLLFRHGSWKTGGIPVKNDARDDTSSYINYHHYSDDSLPSITSLFDDADNQLFNSISANSEHIRITTVKIRI